MNIEKEPADKQKTDLPPLTLGESRVRTRFNVSGSTEVDDVKHRTAYLIDIMNSKVVFGPHSTFPDERMQASLVKNAERNRLIAIAITKYEESAMWAVKALTV